MTVSYRTNAILTYYPTHAEHAGVNRIEFRMHQPKGLITLGDIERKLPENAWTWHVLDYQGIGTAPNDLPMADFEELARQVGYRFDWPSFRQFAEQAEQSWWCLIVALDPDDARSAKEIVASDCDGAYVAIEAFDSSTWTIRSRDPLPLQELVGA